MPPRHSTVPSPVAAGDPCVPPPLLGYGQGPLTPTCCCCVLLLPLTTKDSDPSVPPPACAPPYFYYYLKTETFSSSPLGLVPSPGWGHCYCAGHHSGSSLCPGASRTEPQTLQDRVEHSQETNLPQKPPAAGTGTIPASPLAPRGWLPGPRCAESRRKRRFSHPGKGAHLPASQSQGPLLPALHLGRLYPTQRGHRSGRKGSAREQQVLLSPRATHAPRAWRHSPKHLNFLGK